MTTNKASRTTWRQRATIEPTALVIEPWREAQPVQLDDGRWTPDAFDAMFPGATITVHVHDGVPQIVRLELGDGWQAPPSAGLQRPITITTADLRALKLSHLLAQAVNAATQAGMSRQAFREHELAQADQPLPRRTGRKLKDSDVRQFVARYRQTTGTVAERAAQLDRSASQAYRMLSEAVERNIISDDERRKL